MKITLTGKRTSSFFLCIQKNKEVELLETVVIQLPHNNFKLLDNNLKAVIRGWVKKCQKTSMFQNKMFETINILSFKQKLILFLT